MLASSTRAGPEAVEMDNCIATRYTAADSWAITLTIFSGDVRKVVRWCIFYRAKVSLAFRWAVNITVIGTVEYWYHVIFSEKRAVMYHE